MRDRNRSRDGRLQRALAHAGRLVHGPLRLSGVDTRLFQEILELKLRLDFRRTRRGRGGETTYGLANARGLELNCALFLVFGALGGLVAFAGMSAEDYLDLSESLLFFLVGFSVIGSFFESLFDVSDVTVLGPLPIPERTFLAARTVHLLLYVGAVALSLMIGPLVMGTIAYGVPAFLPAFLIEAVLISALASLGATFCSLLLVRLFDTERLKTLAMGMQMGFVLLVTVGAQILPLLGDSDFQFYEFIASHRWVRLLWPPATARTLLRVLSGAASVGDGLYAVYIPLLVVASGLLALRHGSRGLVARMADLQAAGGAVSRKPWRPVRRALRAVLARGPLRRAGFDYFCGLSRERKFRIRMCGTLGVIVIPWTFPFLEMTGVHPSKLSAFEVVWPVYFGISAAMSWIDVSRIGESISAKWILDTVPARLSGPFLGGIWKGFLATLFFPLLALFALLSAAFGGSAGMLQLLFALGATTMVVFWILTRFGAFLPFSQEPEPGGANMAAGLLALFLVGFAVFFHYVVTRIPYGVLIAPPLVLLGCLPLYRSLDRIALPDEHALDLSRAALERLSKPHSP